jgi:hypothetical protein
LTILPGNGQGGMQSVTISEETLVRAFGWAPPIFENNTYTLRIAPVGSSRCYTLLFDPLMFAAFLRDCQAAAAREVPE